MHALEHKIQTIENELLEMSFGYQGLKLTGEKASLSNRMQYYNVPSISIALVSDYAIEWANGYGITRAGTDTLITSGTIFEAASTTKTITAAIALHYVDHGLLSLDEDINRFLKSWQVPENGFTQQNKVTLRFLLSHQAGFPMTNYGYDEKVGFPTLVQVLQGEFPADNKAAQVEFVPGSDWQYSNVGYDVIQLLLEDQLSKPFAQIVQETILDPLNMKSSTMDYPLTPKMQRREAIPHDDRGVAREPFMHPTALAHGGLMTTPTDLAKFVIELMLAYQGQSSRLLSQQSSQQMFTKILELDPAQTGGLSGSGGLGVLLRGEGVGLSFLHPGINFPGTTCWLEGYPGSGKGSVIMANGNKGLLLTSEILTTITSIEEENGTFTG